MLQCIIFYDIVLNNTSIHHWRYQLNCIYKVRLGMKKILYDYTTHFLTLWAQPFIFDINLLSQGQFSKGLKYFSKEKNCLWVYFLNQSTISRLNCRQDIGRYFILGRRIWLIRYNLGRGRLSLKLIKLENKISNGNLSFIN